MLRKKHEVIWFKGLRGSSTTYLVQRAWHGDVIAADNVLASPKTREAWRRWSDEIAIAGVPDDKRDVLQEMLKR